LGLPLISAANAEEQSAFLGCSSGQTSGFAGEEKQFSQPARLRKLLDQRVKALLTLRLSIFNSGVPF
jgi:hypothetical protein